jgi:hypothetical protein
MCPEQPESTEAVESLYPTLTPMPDFEMAHTAWLDEKEMSHSPKNPPDLVPRAHQVADVKIPSRKVYLFEMPGWCARGRRAEFWRQLGYTPTLPISLLLFDGSARRMSMEDVPPTPWGTLPFITTGDGIRGWDIPP